MGTTVTARLFFCNLPQLRAKHTIAIEFVIDFLFHFEILRFLRFLSIEEIFAIGQISAPNRKSPTAR